MISSTITSWSNTLPSNVPVTATSVLPAPSLNLVGVAVSEMLVLFASSSAIAIVLTADTSPTAICMYIKPRAISALSL